MFICLFYSVIMFLLLWFFTNKSKRSLCTCNALKQVWKLIIRSKPKFLLRLVQSLCTCNAFSLCSYALDHVQSCMHVFIVYTAWNHGSSSQLPMIPPSFNCSKDSAHLYYLPIVYLKCFYIWLIHVIVKN